MKISQHVIGIFIGAVLGLCILWVMTPQRSKPAPFRSPQDIVDTRRMNHEDIAWQVNALGADKFWCRDLCGEKYLNFNLSLEEFKLCNYRCNK